MKCTWPCHRSYWVKGSICFPESISPNSVSRLSELSPGKMRRMFLSGSDRHPQGRLRTVQVLKEEASDAGVPRITGFGRSRAQTLAEAFERIGDGETGDVLHALVAQRAGHAHAERPAEAHGKIAVVHSPGEERLGMQGVGHIDAFPPVGFD